MPEALAKPNKISTNSQLKITEELHLLLERPNLLKIYT